MTMVERKRNPWTGEVAGQLRDAIVRDANYGFERFRDLGGYVYELMGIKHFLEHIIRNKGSLGSDRILDIGTGSGIAASQLRRSCWSRVLTVEATVLGQTNDILKNFGSRGLHVAAIETLKGIPITSIAGIISVFGMAYSRAPDAAITQVDRVLVPSGILKADFYSERIVGYHNPSTPDDFALELKKRGYDVEIINHPRSTTKILLAIKPPITISAKDLLDLDFSDWRLQQDEAMRMFPKV